MNAILLTMADALEDDFAASDVESIGGDSFAGEARLPDDASEAEERSVKRKQVKGGGGEEEAEIEEEKRMRKKRKMKEQDRNRKAKVRKRYRHGTNTMLAACNLTKFPLKRAV